MRTLPELLTLIKKQLEVPTTNTYSTSLCHALSMLNKFGRITLQEYEVLTTYLEDNRPDTNRKLNTYYWWPTTDSKPNTVARVKWLDKHIKLNTP